MFFFIIIIIFVPVLTDSILLQTDGCIQTWWHLSRESYVHSETGYTGAQVDFWIGLQWYRNFLLLVFKERDLAVCRYV